MPRLEIVKVPPPCLARELAVARARDDIVAGAGNLLDAAPVGVTDDGNDEPVGGGDRHADVRRRVPVDLLAVEGGIDRGGAAPARLPQAA